MCSVAQLCPTPLAPEIVACQALLSMEFYRQECWSGMTFPSPEDLLSSGMEPRLLCLLHWQSDSFCPYSDPLSQLPSPVPFLSVSHRCVLCVFIFALFQFSHSVMSNSLQPHGLQHAGFPCSSPTPRTCSNSCRLSW